MEEETKPKRRVPRKKCSRGFPYYLDTKDSYGNPLQIKKSSSAEMAAVWIICKTSEGADWLPHVNVAKAKQVIRALQKFVDDHTEKKGPKDAAG